MIDDVTLGAAAELLTRRAGLHVESSMRGRLDRCLSEVASKLDSPVDGLVSRLESDPSAMQVLLNRLTVQESSFFRDPGQFDALGSFVLPTIERPTTIWSAACANGQEPYSLAMLLDAGGDTTSRVIASDISTDALERTSEGRYSAREVAGLTEEQRRRYLRRVAADAYEVVDEIRNRVEVVHLNLASDPPPFAPGTCPVVFCRNVMIYFGHRQIVSLLGQLHQWMTPDGVLVLGYSESLWQVTELFALERIGSAFVYRRRDLRPVASRGSRAVPEGRSGLRSRPVPEPRPTGSEPREDDDVGTAQRPVRSVRPVRPMATPAVNGPLHASPARTATGPEPAGKATATVTVDVDGMFAVGMEALRDGDLAEAIATFRRCVYLDPDRVDALAHLAFALEAVGDDTAARRAFAAARSTLERCAADKLESSLEGYQPDEWVRLLEMKLEESR